MNNTDKRDAAISRLRDMVAKSESTILTESVNSAMGVMFPELHQFRVRRADGSEAIFSIDPEGNVKRRAVA